MAESSSKQPSRAWVAYVLLTLVTLVLSGALTPRSSRSIAYDEAVMAVREDRVASAVVRGDEVLLELKIAGGKRTERVRVARLPNVEDEPLIDALLSQHVRIEAQSTRAPWWMQALYWAVPLVLLNAAFLMAIRRASPERGTGAFGFLARSRLEIYPRSEQERARFSDVAGVDEAKDELVEVVEFLKYPEKYRALGGRIPRGLLLIGPPGAGKTLLARAVAGEAGVPFISFSASELVEIFACVGATRIPRVFEHAKKSSPSIVFIDEIDAVGRTRGGLGALAANDEREPTLHQLLAELDGFDERATVILIGATSRPDLLDPALLRPGRFDRRVIVDRPDLHGREAILAVHARRVPLAAGVDLGAVARRTVGMAGADLANIVNEAALAGARRSAGEIAQADFEDALERTQLGLRRRGLIMTPIEKRRVAYHEAGHALIALSMPEADSVDRVSIVAPTIGALGAHVRVPREERRVITERELETRVTVMLGGRAAEELALGEVSTGAHDDLGRATMLVREMVSRFGMSRRLGISALTRPLGAAALGNVSEERLCSEQTAREIDEEVRDRMSALYLRAKQILGERRSGLDAAAEGLIACETLSGEELARLAVRAETRAMQPGDTAA